MYNSDKYPLVSIVIPVFKPMAFFMQTLESIQQQTFQNFELIISDNYPEYGNTQLYLNQFSTLNIKYKENSQELGIFNNLNYAIRNSSGKYIQIFCQDDIMMPDFLHNQVALFSKFPSIGLGFSRYTDIDRDGKVFAPHAHMEEAVSLWSTFIPQEKALNYLFAYGCLPGSLSPVMLKREVFEETGFFNQAFSFAGDFEYWIRVARQFDFAVNKTHLLQVRTHKERASKTIGLLKLIPDMTTLLCSLYQYNTVSSSKLRKYLQVNNLVVGYFKEIFLNVATGKFRYLLLLKYLQKKPFNIAVIVCLIFQRYYKGKVSWFVKEKEC